MNPEDEYFARREGEIERDRDRRDGLREEHEKLERLEALEKRDTPPPPQRAEPRGRVSKIVGAMRTALRAVFGGGGDQRPRNA